MADVLVTENIVGPAMEALKKSFQVAFDAELWKHPAPLADAVARARALIVRNQTQVTSELIARAGELQIIARAGVGLDNIDVEAASRSGIVVSFTPSQNSITVAELTVGLMLALARKLAAADRHVKGGGWDRLLFTGRELYGKTLGIVGFGRIGFLTARRAAAFGMDVMAYDPYLDPDALTVAEARPRIVGLDELLAAADFVTCHLPGNEQTRRMFSYDRFCQMRPSAMFINVARGEVVDEAGLLRALREGKIAGAALDVRAQEPPQKGPFDAMDNVILTPHIGGFTHEAQHRVVAAVCRDVAAVLGGGRAVNYANFPLPKKRELRNE
jgi:D-3-phosphoglycerate dehydrogenase